MNKLCVYILMCNDSSYYIGVTNNIERRILEHQSGDNKKACTFYRRPLELIWYSEDMDAIQAIELEKQIKGWKRAKKEALIKKDWKELIKLSAIRKSNVTLREPQDDGD